MSVRNNLLSSNRQENGFTFIEVLAALVVSSVLIISMIGAIRFSQTRGENARISNDALQLVVSKMDDAETGLGPLRSISGKTNGLFWRRQVQSLRTLNKGKIALYNVTISAGKNNNPRLIVLQKRMILSAQR